MRMQSSRLRILATGMGWPSVQPGGLNTYFRSINEQLAVHHDVHAIICSNDVPAVPERMQVTNVANPAMSVAGRRKAFRAYAARWMDRQHVDVVYAHFAPYSIGVAMEARKRGIPVVMAFHGPWSEEMKVEGRGMKHAVKTMVARAIERKAYALADAFIVLSETFRDVLHHHYQVPLDKIRIIPGAADTRRFQPPVDKQEVKRRFALEGHRTVLTVRRLVNRMGLLQLLDAWKDVVREVPDAMLLIGGKGPLKQELEDAIAEYGLSGQVRLLGYVPDNLLPEYYQAADLFVVPTQTLEGFGLITVEAMASGLPVMATPIGGSREILAKFRPEMLFASAGAVDMAAGLTHMLRQPEQWPTGAECRAHVMEHYTWERVAAQVEDVFAAVIGQQSRSHDRGETALAGTAR